MYIYEYYIHRFLEVYHVANGQEGHRQECGAEELGYLACGIYTCWTCVNKVGLASCKDKERTESCKKEITSLASDSDERYAGYVEVCFVLFPPYQDAALKPCQVWKQKHSVAWSFAQLTNASHFASRVALVLGQVEENLIIHGTMKGKTRVILFLV